MKQIVNSPSEINGKRVVQNPLEIMNALSSGETIYHWEYGDSLSPLINNGEYIQIQPCKPSDVKVGDCIFCLVEDFYGNLQLMVHQVLMISDASHDGELWFKIGTTSNEIFGWAKKVYGIAKGTNIFQEGT